MSLKLKIFSLFGIFVLGLLVFAALSWQTINTAKVNGDFYQQIVTQKDLIADILPPPEYIIESYLLVFQMLDERDPTAVEKLLPKFRELRKAYDERHQFWTSRLKPGKLKDEMLVNSYKPACEFYDAAEKEFLPALQRGDKETASRVLTTVLKPHYELHRQTIDTVVALADEDLKSIEQKVEQVIAKRITLLVVLGLAIVVFCLLSAWSFLDRWVIRPIMGIAEALMDGSDQVAGAAAQISTASQSLAEGASQQAASIEETSSSLEEMSSMTRQNADNTAQADSLMGHTNQVIKKGSNSLTGLNTSMHQISASSDETAKIIKTIDEIAFQTNLLALNAAVEAARAGEAGAGFAVVADEVRNLAMRAAEAARNTANLIEDTINKVKSGSESARQTVQDFAEISEGSSKVIRLVAEIAAASQEQTQGVEHINRAVSEMERVVQLTAANAEESASAVEELAAQTQQIRGSVHDLLAIIGKNARRNDNKSSSHTHLREEVQSSARRKAVSGMGAPRPKAPAPAVRARASSKSSAVDPEKVIPFEEGLAADF